jgi:hypothetical protein
LGITKISYKIPNLILMKWHIKGYTGFHRNTHGGHKLPGNEICWTEILQGLPSPHPSSTGISYDAWNQHHLTYGAPQDHRHTSVALIIVLRLYRRLPNCPHFPLQTNYPVMSLPNGSR